MSTPVTETQVPVVVGSATLVGREWEFPPLFPWSGDVTTEADTYRTRNAGKTRKVDTFLNVRYAEPPVGELRWKEAVDYDYPAGTYQLDTMGGTPWQTYSLEGGGNGRPEWGVDVGNGDWKAMEPGGTTETEDCLHLSIWRPQGTPPAGGWPVVVRIHGGGNTVNSANAFQGRGHRLATKGVIVVAVEYRLGVFGYFSHPDYNGEVDWNGPNLAYSDVKSALRWVNRNIADLNGNPAKVLATGSSAGGAHVLHLQEDSSVSALFSSAWAMSGGGIGNRYQEEADSWREGYASFNGRFSDAVEAVEDILKDASGVENTVADSIATNGRGVGMRLSLSPQNIQAFAAGRDRISRASLQAGTATYTAVGPINRYPFIGNGLTYRSNVLAARAGEFVKPIIISSAENEASVTDSASWSDATTTNFCRLTGIFSYDEWKDLAWHNGSWDATEDRRLIYNHNIFQYPAWRESRAMVDTASATCWLALWGFSNGTTANHSSDVPYALGNVEWSVGMNGTEAAITERVLEMSDAMMNMVVNMAANSNPNTTYVLGATDFDLFASPVVLGMTAANGVDTNHWNVIGTEVADSANTAPASVTFKAYFGGAWADYLAGMET